MFTEKEMRTVKIVISRLRQHVMENDYRCQGDEDIEVLEGVLKKMEIISKEEE